MNPSASTMLRGASLYILRVPPLDEIANAEISALAESVRAGNLREDEALNHIEAVFPDEILSWVDFNYQIDNATTSHIEKTNLGLIQLGEAKSPNSKNKKSK